MARMERSVAGRQVAARSRRLADELLGVEVRLFADFEAAYIARGPDVRVALDRMLVAGLGERPRNEFVGILAIVAAEVRAVAVRQFEQFLRGVAEDVIDSIGDELTLCERTLAARHAGLTAEAMVVVLDERDALIETSAEAFDRSLAGEGTWLVEQVAAEIRASVSAQEDTKQVASRLFAPTAIRLPSHSGRGLWWQMYQRTTQHARGTQFALVNTIRNRAMTAFNALGEGR